MERDTEPTLVVFRRWRKKDGGGIIALFPAIVADHRGHCSSYMHVGQHAAADYHGMLLKSLPARVDEADVQNLTAELSSLGYLLKPIRRYGSRSQHRTPPPRKPALRPSGASSPTGT
jgi:hypothetical protein